MSARHDLRHSIFSVLKHNKDGSFATQANRETQLLKFGDDLLAKGFYIRNIHQLKAKHIHCMLESWNNLGISVGTIKNRLANIRWLCEKINKPGLIPANNDALKIGRRQYITGKNKSINIQETDLSKITDQNVLLILRLQQAFGLRREESIKIKIHQAVQSDTLVLQGSWCKNGRARVVPIRTPEQWRVIEDCKMYVPDKHCSLIPIGKTYYQQMKKYENELSKAGISKAHGLRHAYAQQRYFELTGWQCPVKGGPSKKQLTHEQLLVDQAARKTLTGELGHERISILAIYLN